MKKETIHTKKGSVTLLEPGIIRFELNENSEWGLEDAIETHAANLKLSGGEKFCVYMNASRFFIPSKDAQKFVISKVCTDYRLGTAFIVKNAGLKIFASLFINFFKSKTPTRIFDNEKEALIWMRERLKEA